MNAGEGAARVAKDGLRGDGSYRRTIERKAPARAPACAGRWAWKERENVMSFVLSSSDFVHDGEIPSRFTCEGADVSPALEWTDPPAGTQSFALIVDDPDAPDPAAPKMVYVHWVLYNLPPALRVLGQAIEEDTLPQGVGQGLNDWKRPGYGGPCPPIGRHRYFFKLYALDTTLPDLQQPTKARLEQAMTGHILAQSELMGTYQKQR